MTTVWSDPARFAVDWDCQRGLTVWALAGRRSEPQFDGKVLEHELSARPGAASFQILFRIAPATTPPRTLTSMPAGLDSNLIIAASIARLPSTPARPRRWPPSAEPAAGGQ
jgi:hypothetical protein